VRPHRALASLASTQVGLFTLDQALAVGLTHHQLAHALRSGRLERVARAVYSMPGHGPSWERDVLAAVMAAGPGAVASHTTAATLLGFDGFGPAPVEVTVPRGRRARITLARVHTSEVLPPLDVVRVARFRVTSGARTLVDLGHRVGEDVLAAAVGSALRDGWTSEAFLRRRLGGLAGRRGVGALRRALEGPIAHSHLERRFLALIEGAGLPLPRTQVTYRGERVMRVDAVWEEAWLVAELMGHRFHATAEDLQRDAQRRNELQSIGFEVLEFTSLDLDRHPASVVSRMARTLIRRRDALRELVAKSVTSADRDRNGASRLAG
jgi:hypothetical protein